MKSLKKLLAVLMAVMMVFSLAACGDDSSSDVSVAETNADGNAIDDEIVTETPYFDAGSYLDQNGFYNGVKALDIVTLPDYSSITIPKETYVMSDEVYQEKIQSIIENNTETVQVTDRAVKDGDSVNIDYVGSVDGITFSGGSTNGAGTTVTIGVTSYIDDFLEQLIGHKPGDTFDVNVTFPDSYPNNTDLEGKDAVFVTTINYIEEEQVPELNDELVTKLYSETNGWTTVAQLKEGLAEIYKTSQTENYVADYLFDNSVIGEIPEVCYNYCRAYYEWQIEFLCSQYSMSVSEYCSAYGFESFDDLYESVQDTVNEQIQRDLVFQALAEDMGYVPTEEDMRAYFVSLYGETDADSYFESYTTAMSLNVCKHSLLQPLLVAKLQANGNIIYG